MGGAPRPEYGWGSMRSSQEGYGRGFPPAPYEGGAFGGAYDATRGFERGYGSSGQRGTGQGSYSGSRGGAGFGSSFGGRYEEWSDVGRSGGSPGLERGRHRGKGPKGYQRSDERIREMLLEKGVDVARRTVNKYRSRTKMLSSRQRRSA